VTCGSGGELDITETGVFWTSVRCGSRREDEETQMKARGIESYQDGKPKEMTSNPEYIFDWHCISTWQESLSAFFPFVLCTSY
jgi:hypothetical protein